jgi:molybdopterin-guanine dinucleotide biosynthesis protein A
MSDSSAAILTGGRATRFAGRDKSALVVEGRTILDRQLSELASITDDVLIVGTGVAQAGRRSTPLRIAPRQIGDIVSGCGPLGGLHAALTAARGNALFVIACDMPFVTAAFADYLLSLSGDAEIVVPQTERGYHPLCAVYTRACLDSVAARLADRRLRLGELVADRRTRVVSVEDIARFGDPYRLLANVNTPAEYAGLEALQGHKL